MNRAEHWVLGDQARRRVLSHLVVRSGVLSGEALQDAVVRALRHLPWDQASLVADSLNALSAPWVLRADALAQRSDQPLHREAGRVFLARAMLGQLSDAAERLGSLTSASRLDVAMALTTLADDNETEGGGDG